MYATDYFLNSLLFQLHHELFFDFVIEDDPETFNLTTETVSWLVWVNLDEYYFEDGQPCKIQVKLEDPSP